MPKIIKDVEKNIKNCAIELFVEFSYTNVDMKMISKKSGVAVGTLYNYYKSKKQLYLSILEESWQNTFNKLDDISELPITSDKKLKSLIEILYEDIETRNGLGKALIDTSVAELKDDKEITDLKNKLIFRISNLFKYLSKVDTLSTCSDVDTRLAESLLTSMLIMLEFHPNEKEHNINFLVKFIGLSIK